MTAKKWMTVFPRIVSDKYPHPSKAATYRYVRLQAQLWHQGHLRSQSINIYVDERDGYGWKLYERIDLDEMPVDTEPNHA